MSKQYTLEFAVKSVTELEAMERLKILGITKADRATLSDLDRQAGLFIIKVSADELELSDDTYQKLLLAKDIFILSDELSAMRAQKIISLTAAIEQQLKKLLICVLPETEKVLSDIVNTHQRHGSDFMPSNRIEWCKKINDFSFGELPKVLEEDVSELAKKQLLSSEGLLSLIALAKDFDELKAEITELSKPKTVWSSVNSILETPVDYSYISGALNNLCKARNDASHLNTITAKRLVEIQKDQKHVLSYISNIKSSYRENLQESMAILADAMKPILESAVKIDPTFFTGYQKKLSEMFKPFTETVSGLNLNIVSPGFIDVIKQNSNYQSQIAKSMTGVFENMKTMDGYKETMKQFANTGFTESMSASLKEATELKFDMGKIIEASRKEGIQE